MRQWLDRERYELSRYICNREGNTGVVCIAFTADGAAEAFAKRFLAQTRRSGRPHFISVRLVDDWDNSRWLVERLRASTVDLVRRQGVRLLNNARSRNRTGGSPPTGTASSLRLTSFIMY